MALSNYAELKTSVADWLNRSNLTNQIPDFITLAEAQMRRRLRRKTVRASTTFTSDSYTLPSDCAELRSVRLVTSQTFRDTPIEIGTPEILAKHRAHLPVTGRPRFGSIVAGKLLLAPAPDTTYNAEITYFQKITPLSDSNTTNAALTDAPDLYLYGALLEAAPYLQDDERIPIWQSRFNSALEELNTAREREEFTASLRPMGLPVVFG